MGQRWGQKVKAPWNLSLPPQSLYLIRSICYPLSPSRIPCPLCHMAEGLTLCPLLTPQEPSSVKKPINNHPTCVFYY